MPWKFILLFENGRACFQGSRCAPGDLRAHHFTIGKPHLVPIERFGSFDGPGSSRESEALRTIGAHRVGFLC
jgi:hypothetical protein